MKIKTKIMPAVVALWFSFLLLPFKGIRAALLLFLILIIAIPAMKYSLGYLSAVTRKIQFPSGRFHGIHSLANRYAFILLIPLLIVPFIAEDYIMDVAISLGIYTILALGLNVVVGFTGLLNLGFVAFYAIGAYSYALLNTKLGMGFWSALPLSIFFTTISGFLLAIPALRLKGDYLAIVTLGFGEITRLILNNWDRFTKGPNGISNISPPHLLNISFNSLSHFYFLILFCVLITVFVMKRVHDSKIGRAWTAIREDEIASSAMGVNTTVYKLYSFAFAAFWAGLAGCLFASKMRFVSPESFTFMESVLILCMVILGGLGSIAGVVIGAVILIFLPEVLREIQMYRMLALGCGLVLLMIFRPQGLFGGRRASA